MADEREFSIFLESIQRVSETDISADLLKKGGWRELRPGVLFKIKPGDARPIVYVAPGATKPSPSEIENL